MSNKPPHILELLPKRYTLWGVIMLILAIRYICNYMVSSS